MASLAYAQSTPPSPSISINVTTMNGEDEEKVAILTEDMELPSYLVHYLLADFNLKVPEGWEGADFGSELQTVIGTCLNRLSQSEKDPISRAVQSYISFFTKEELQQIADWYNSDLGRKAREMNTELSLQLAEAKRELEEIRKQVYEERYGGNKNSKKAKKKKKPISRTRQ